MAIIIGGTDDFPGKNNKLTGTVNPDVIFGDRFTKGNFLGVPEIGGDLSSGTSGPDQAPRQSRSGYPARLPVRRRFQDGRPFIAVHGHDTVLDLGLAAGGLAGEDTLTLPGVTDLRPSDILLA